MESNRRFCFSWLIHLCIDDHCLYLHLYLTSVLGREPTSWGATPGFEAHLSEYVSNEMLLKKHPEIKGIRHEKSQEPFLEHKFLESPQMDRSIFPSRSLFDIWSFFFFGKLSDLFCSWILMIRELWKKCKHTRYFSLDVSWRILFSALKIQSPWF